MQTNKKLGLIYKVLPYKESAKMVFVYTETGKYTLIFQGAQKTNNLNRVTTQYLTLIEFELKNENKRMQSISQAKIINDYENIKDDYFRTKESASILEVIDRVVTDNDNHEQIFKIAKKSLENDKIGYLKFLAQLLPIIGYHLNIKPDGRKIRGYNLLLNRLIYENETEGITLDILETTELVRLFIYQDEKEFMYKKQLEQFLIKYYDYYLQYQFKTLK